MIGDIKMAYDLIKQQWYDFDIHSIITLCKQSREFVPLYKYLDLWEGSLVKIQNNLYSDIEMNKEAITKFTYENELYQFPFTFNDRHNFIFQFNATSINKTLAQMKDKKIEEFELDLFEEISSRNSKSIYQYSYIKNVGKNYLIDKPIIIVNFKGKYSNGIVVDGNHRLSAYKKYDKSTIKGVIIFPTGVFHFGTPFDRAMYLFYNEFTIFSFYLRQGYSADALLKNSLLRLL